MKNNFTIKIQTKDFNFAEEYEKLKKNSKIGSIVTFCGLVRDFNSKSSVKAIFLQCYDKMAQKELELIAQEAITKYNLLQVNIIHRKGLLKAGEQIVYIGVASHHRNEGIKAVEYLIDYLKVRATFWKKELDDNGNSEWLTQKKQDINKVKNKT